MHYLFKVNNHDCGKKLGVEYFSLDVSSCQNKQLQKNYGNPEVLISTSVIIF
jgi:hypothetical protein